MIRRLIACSLIVALCCPQLGAQSVVSPRIVADAALPANGGNCGSAQFYYVGRPSMRRAICEGGRWVYRVMEQCSPDPPSGACSGDQVCLAKSTPSICVCGDAGTWSCISGGGGGGGGGAPTTARYLVTQLDGTLTEDRLYVAGNGIACTDGGANGNYTCATSSTEAGFFSASGTSCGAGNAGRAWVTSSALAYCDNQGTPALRYTADADSTGKASRCNAADRIDSDGDSVSSEIELDDVANTIEFDPNETGSAEFVMRRAGSTYGSELSTQAGDLCMSLFARGASYSPDPYDYAAGVRLCTDDSNAGTFEPVTPSGGSSAPLQYIDLGSSSNRWNQFYVSNINTKTLLLENTTAPPSMLFRASGPVDAMRLYARSDRVGQALFDLNLSGSGAPSSADECIVNGGPDPDCDGTADIVQWVHLPTATCRAGTAESDWSLPASNAATASCLASNEYGVLTFANGASVLTANARTQVPAGQHGNVSYRLQWASGGGVSTNSVSWRIYYACKGDAEDITSLSFTLGPNPEPAALGTGSVRQTSSGTFSASGCSGDETMFLRVTRDPNDAQDTLAADAYLLDLVLGFKMTPSIGGT